MVATGDEDAIAARVHATRDAGGDHVALIPISPSGHTEHLPALELLENAVGLP